MGNVSMEYMPPASKSSVVSATNSFFLIEKCTIFVNIK